MRGGMNTFLPIVRGSFELFIARNGTQFAKEIAERLSNKGDPIIASLSRYKAECWGNLVKS